MTSVREEILTVIQAALDSAASSFPGGAATVIRAPRLPIEDQEAPEVSLIPGGMTNIEGQTGGERRRMSVALEILVAAETEEALDPLVSEAHAWGARTMLGLNEAPDFTAWGEAVREVEMTDPEPLDDAGIRPAAVFGIFFEIYFETAEFDPSAKP